MTCFLLLFSSTDVSLFVAIDCEMDQSHGKNYICKISIVDEDGQILFDTLVNPEVEITYSLYRIHGIRSEWLNNAPTLPLVKDHVTKVFGNCIFVGHGVRHDL
jgi:DNA polymerase III epsilon subunit-like protein